MLSLAPPAAPPAEVAAMALEVRGSVEWTPAGQAAAKPLRAVDLLRPADRVTVPAGGQALLFFVKDGHLERFQTPATLQITAQGGTPADKVTPETRVKVSPAQLARLKDLVGDGQAAVGVLRAPDGAPSPHVLPVFGTVVLTDRPTFAWDAGEGAAGYVLEVKAAGSNRLVWRQETRDCRLTLPADKALAPDRLFLWTVRARKADQPEPHVQGRFLTAPAADRAAVAGLDTQGDQADALLLAALSYEAVGALEPALAAYERVAQLRPQEARLQEVLASYYDRAGEAAKAGAARARAAELLKAARP
jgi:hypothetical protein